MRTLAPRVLTAVVAALVAGAIRAEGHGPAFGLATPTLARGQWSSDTAAMRMDGETGATTWFRQMLGYGVTEDIQLNLAFPLGQSGPDPPFPSPRGASMMGAAESVEASLQWRFHRTAPAIGTRRESTLIAGVSQATDDASGGAEVGTAFNLAAVTGHASRTTYWWLGGGVQGHASRGGTESGAAYHASAVFGWRPPIFRQDYPKPDWRVFVEAQFEKSERHRVRSVRMPDSGGERVLIGPSFLGLYGRWGVEGGIIWPVSQSLNGDQPDERYRAKLVLTYWF